LLLGWWRGKEVVYPNCKFQFVFLLATMDVETLHVVLQQSFSPDGNLRVPAEETIRTLKHIKGASTLLLQVAAEQKVSVRSERSPIYTIFQS
jgi:hypothetical protein